MAAYDISRAMIHFHKNNIIYRDLKPENIGFDIGKDVNFFVKRGGYPMERTS